MTEEEKQAIETVQQYKKCFIFETVHEETGERLNDYSNAIDIVLNLIKKQQKEIKKLTRLNSAYKTNYDSKVLKEERKNKKILEGYISKDKIRDKIKEITEYYEKEVKLEMYHWGDFSAEEHFADIIARYNELLEE